MRLEGECEERKELNKIQEHLCLHILILFQDYYVLLSILTMCVETTQGWSSEGCLPPSLQNPSCNALVPSE